ncbi:MAG: aromatic amino acid lyase, partial [bacterium]|nr:aromatic amino acid lyase [Candidatus Minthenecus merdequi]
MKYVITDKISIEDIKSIIFENRQIELSKESVARIQKCRDYLDNKMKTQKEPIYGVTTGFGSLCNISVGADELSQLQKNLVMSHSCGTGDPV